MTMQSAIVPPGPPDSTPPPLQAPDYPMHAKIIDSNFPIDEEGRVYHVSVKPGDVANRIVTAGDPARILRFAGLLDPVPKPFKLASARGYLTITGRYKGVPVTLMAIGMGFPMMDLMVREVRAVVEGDLAIIRFGSCGSVDESLSVGSIGVPSAAMTIMTNYDHYYDQVDGVRPPPFIFSKPIPSDPVLHQKLLHSLSETVASPTTQIRDIALHASADLFYSSQGRIDPSFLDDNETLLTELHAAFPTLSSLEMETAHLFHLAHIAAPAKGRIFSAAAHMIFAGRTSAGHEFIDPAQVARLEPIVGRACLDAVIAFEIPDEKLHPEEGSAWEVKN